MDEINKYSFQDHKETDDVELQAEVDHLKQHLSERDAHIVALEAEFVNCTAKNTDLEEQVNTWREKYERLYDSHKRVQKLNQVLEDKLLQMVDKMKSEKSQLTKDIATLSVRLAESKHNYGMLQKENERYKNDMNLAIQLLQCKPDNFVSHKLDNLPVDTQARVSQYVMSKSKPSILSNNKNGNDSETFDASEYEFNISASLMTKILEDSIQDTVTKHCDTCTCSTTQAKPFSYNETSYTVATQTHSTGEMKNSLCLNCNADVKSLHSNLSNRSPSPHAVKLINDKTTANLRTGPMYIIPQPTGDITHIPACTNHVKDTTLFDNNAISPEHQKDVIPKINNSTLLRKSSSMQMEPGVHHKLCDRTRSVSSKISCNNSIHNEELIIKDANQTKDNTKTENFPETSRMRENSQSSMGAVSRTSSIAKSSTSTQKSNTIVGPGPRFCSLRVQAGSKNILLDNAQPDVPPVLYRRQSRCNDNTLFNDLTDTAANFLNEENANKEEKNNSVVVESTLIDVHVDNNVKDNTNVVNETSINPVLLNVSSSPLQPLKTHNFNNVDTNKTETIDSKPNVSEVDKLLEGMPIDNANEIKQSNEDNAIANKLDVIPKVEDDKGIKLFNFDQYEQNSLSNIFNKPYRTIDMAHFHSLENTKISKDLPPLGDEPTEPTALTKDTVPKPGQVVNVYSNLAQTHLKVNDSNKIFEKSTSSLSSDDSAALLQKQQLLRVAEWVEQNLEQHNVFNDPSLAEDEATFNKTKRERLDRLAESFNTLALNMPHPVSKYAKPRGDVNWNADNPNPSHNRVVNVSKETIFPVECDENESSNVKTFDEVCAGVANDISQALASNGEKEITAEDLARMEYNVKQFLLSGPQWVSSNYGHRSRRTTSKTETDV